MLAAGALGGDVFARFDVDLDLSHGKILLYVHTSCAYPAGWSTSASSVPIELHNRDIEFPIAIDGKSVTAELHTGNCCSGMSTMLAHRLFGLDANAPGVTEQAGSLFEQATFHYPFHALNLGQVTLADPNFTLFDLSCDLRKFSWTAAKALSQGTQAPVAGLRAEDFPRVHCGSCHA